MIIEAQMQTVGTRQ